MDPLNGSFLFGTQLGQGNEQKGSYLWAFLITVIVCIGAACFIFPRIYPYIFENKELDAFLTKVTVLFLLLVLSGFGIMLFVRSIVRGQQEGFVDSDAVLAWKKTLQNQSLDDVCSLYSEIYESQVKVEMGTPPNEISEQQARERVEFAFKTQSPLGIFSCSQYKTMKASTDLDSIYLSIQTVPDTFLAQAYQTMLLCKSLLSKTLKDVQDSLDKVKVEGFGLAIPLCSPEAASKRKALLTPVEPSNNPSKCVTVSEIPPEQKNAEILSKLQTIQTAYMTIKGNGKEFNDLYNECMALKNQLQTLKSKAEAGTLIS